MLVILHAKKKSNNFSNSGVLLIWYDTALKISHEHTRSGTIEKEIQIQYK